MQFGVASDEQDSQDDLYTEEFLRDLPSKRVVNQANESNPVVQAQANNASETKNNASEAKKGMSGLSGLRKGELQVKFLRFTNRQANAYLMTKYNIFINLTNGFILIEELIIELPNECIVEECIKQSIKIFLQRIEDKKLSSLPTQPISQNLSDYQLYIANKKGERKVDLPALEATQVLSNTHIYKFALVSKQKFHNTQIIGNQQIEQQKNEAKQPQQLSQQKEQQAPIAAIQPKQVDSTENYQNTLQQKQIANKQAKKDEVNEEMVSETCCLCFKVKHPKKK